MRAYFIQHMGSFNYGKIRTMGAVLVAISIPIFTSQLEKSRDAVTVSNIRAAYAQASAAYLTGADSNDSKVVVSGTAVIVKNVIAKGTADGFAGDIDDELPIASSSNLTAMGNGSSATNGFDITFTWTANSDAAPVATCTVSQ